MKDLEDWISKLREFDGAIIVEGKKDKIALEKLGAKNIITIKGALFNVVEEIVKKYKKVAILTDLDKKGKELYSKLKKSLVSNGVKIEDKFRIFLFRKTKLRQIEGLIHYIEKNL